MVTLDECISCTCLTVDELDVIAQHERITIIEAAELGEALSKTPQGLRLIRTYIEECLEVSRSGRRARQLRDTLEQFCTTHPEAA
mgnify:CR=1 FL=1